MNQPIEKQAYVIDELKLSDNIIPQREIDDLVSQYVESEKFQIDLKNDQIKLPQMLNSPKILFADFLIELGLRDQYKDIYTSSLFTPSQECHWSQSESTQTHAIQIKNP